MGRTADAVEEGLAIASAAARLAVRNHILVEAIANDATYDPDQVAAFARETLTALADEQTDAAATVRRQRKVAFGKYSDPHGTHDYRDRDTRNLRRRERQYRGVAKELRERAENPEAVTALVEEARDAAWGDVESNLQRRLSVEAMRAENDPDYDNMREARMQALRLVDLPRLRAHRRRISEAARGVVEPDLEPG
jgi:hypothetical protein